MRRGAARLARLAADIALAGVVALTGAGVLLARRAGRRPPVGGQRPRLLVLNAAYSLSVLRVRKAEHLVTHRDLDGYFEHVWTVHPLVGADRTDHAHYGIGPPRITRLNDAHTMVEGKIERLGHLARLPYLNFALAQVQLVLLLDRLVRREGIAIVRGDPYYNGLLALLLGRLNGRPVEIRIVANHDAIYEAVGSLAYPRLFRSRAVERRVARFTLSRADSVAVGSADHREFALRNGARTDRLTDVGNWGMINPVHRSEPSERPAPAEDLGLGDRPILVCVSRLERMKYPEDVIASLVTARERHPSLAAVMIGAGAMRDELADLSAQLGVQSDVVFAGERDQGWVASMLAHSTVVAAPIAGLALVESALSGTPIVAYDVDWHSEFLRQGQDGLLVPYRDTDAMAAAICELIEHPKTAFRLAASARARALRSTEPAEIVAHERGLAHDLLAPGSSPS